MKACVRLQSHVFLKHPNFVYSLVYFTQTLPEVKGTRTISSASSKSFSHSRWTCVLYFSTHIQLNFREVNKRVTILYGPSNFLFSLIIERLKERGDKYPAFSALESNTLSYMYILTLPFVNCFSPMMRVLSNISTPGPAATHSSFWNKVCMSCEYNDII